MLPSTPILRSVQFLCEIALTVPKEWLCLCLMRAQGLTIESQSGSQGLLKVAKQILVDERLEAIGRHKCAEQLNEFILDLKLDEEGSLSLRPNDQQHFRWPNRDIERQYISRKLMDECG